MTMGQRRKENCKFGTVVAFNVHPSCELALIWALGVWVFAPESFSIFKSRSTLQHSRGVFAEASRYFCENTADGLTNTVTKANTLT
jgi:hypothetical protein